MAGRQAVVFLAKWIAMVLCFSHVDGGSGKDYKICGSLPELHAANVAGRLPSNGGVDIIHEPGTSACSQRTYVDLRYRQVDGKCNHRLDYGSTFKPVKRYLRAHYQDRFRYNTPRIFSVVNGYLPSPRKISSSIHFDKPDTDSHTMWVMQFGQLLDHDITSFPVPTESNRTIKCCNQPTDNLHEACFPIPIPSGDKIFDTCMEFVRSEPFHDEGGEIRYPREQINVLTAFVDLSSIYGNDDEALRRLRTRGGTGMLLKTVRVHGKERLPLDEEAVHPDCLVSHQADSYCQLSGDKRVNEQPGLGSAHLVFHLYHNYVVKQLVAGILRKRGVNPTKEAVNSYIENSASYTQEKIFQESRKLSGAIFQKITYCDWLPIIIGPDLIRKFQLGCDKRSYYNPYVDPRIANAFSTAAFRFGHSLIPNLISIDKKKLDLKDQFMIPDSTLSHFESIVEGMCQAGSQEVFDRHVTTVVRDHLFESVFGSKGALDLVALNIQRGRDHGIPGYYYWRRYYGLKRYTSFKDFKGIAEDLKSMYSHLLDVDLFSGGLSEKSVPGGVVGETFGHIIANQFADLKYGDAHFFLSKEVPQGFTSDQISSVMRISLANILCKINSMQSVQPNAFLRSNPNNYERPCDEYEDLDVTPWLIYF